MKAESTGNVVYLKDVATVRDTWSEVPDRLFYNGQEAVEMSVFTSNGQDFLSYTEQVKNYISNFNESASTVKLSISNDRSISLLDRTRILIENGGLGILLVLILLSLFLKPSLAFWVAVGIPVSFLGMFIIVPDMITINIMSLFGMIIVIGILVDDGIVIGENIFHHYEKGKSAIRAAIDGTMEVLPAIVSAILTTVVAFSTFLFVRSRLGDFYKEVAIVVIVTLLFSLIEALIILPAHIAHSRAMKRGKKGFLLNRYADQLMSWMRDKLYSPFLKFCLKNPVLGFAVPIAMLVLTVGSTQGGIIGVTFFPRVASDQININLKMPQGTSEQITDSILTYIEEQAWTVNDKLTESQTGNLPVVENMIRRIGPGASQGVLTLNLLPGEKRDRNAPSIANDIEQAVGPVIEAEQLTYGAGGNFGGQPVSVALMGSNIEQLKGAKAEFKRKLVELGSLKDISDNDPAGIKELRIQLKENAYLMGLTLNDVMGQVRSGFFGQAVQRFQRGRDEIRVWVRYDLKDRQSIKNLDDMWVVTPSRERVPFSEIANYDIVRGNVDINHLDGVRQIRVEADLKDPDGSATDALEVIRRDIMPTVIAKFPTVQPLFEGQNRTADETGDSMRVILPTVLILMYMIIAFTFRSYTQPLLLFLLIPFSFIGVAWGHWIHGMSVSILSSLGVIALVGILVNDGLVLVSKFNNYLREGMEFSAALQAAGRSRFRAIFLTSITTTAGLAPLILESSRTAQFLIPMAISIVYGIIVGTFLTLFMLPLLLQLSNSIKVGITWLRTGQIPDRSSLERPVREQIHEREAEIELTEVK